MGIPTFLTLACVVGQPRPVDALPPTRADRIVELEVRVEALKAELDDCLATQAGKTTKRKFRTYGSMRELLAKMPKEYNEPTRFDAILFEGVNGWMHEMRGQIFEAVLTCSATLGNNNVQFTAPPERVGKYHYQAQIFAYLRQPGQKRTQPVKLGQTYHINGIISSTSWDPMTGVDPITYTIGLVNCRVRPAPKRK